MSNSIWGTLSSIDCSDHIEKKGQFSYLAWTWAWAIVKERYPLSNYELLPDTVYPDGTMEVRVSVMILSPDELVLKHTMWLPVLDFKNKPIPNPNAFDINTARMRCLVKCLAMFGLGHYIYAGESSPAPSPAQQEEYDQLVKLVANEDSWALRAFTETMGDKMDELFNMAPDGHKTKFKGQVREVYAKSNESLKATLAVLEEAVGNPDSSYSCTEIMDELSSIERGFVERGMNPTLLSQVTEKLERGE
jgi:hypothetical protein